MVLSECLFLTDEFESVQEFRPEDKSAYIFGESLEARSVHFKEWETRGEDIQFIQILDEKDNSFIVKFPTGDKKEVQLRSAQQFHDLYEQINKSILYLDITGLSHHIWGPLLKAALLTRKEVKGIYVEPGDYKFSPTPTEGEIFDLSERIKGISPIPGFASLTEFDDDNICFVPLLGFEGTRFAHLVEHAQPQGESIIPIVGVPGFMPEFPFYTYLGNRPALLDTKSWRKIRFAKANCPFSLFYLLRDITTDYPAHRLKIAPIGTKPHALGAILFYISNTKSVELIYDHPIRKSDRTSGTGKLLVYHLSSFFSVS